MIWSGKRVIDAMQLAVDTRALEMAAAVRAEHSEHKDECRNRYIAIDAKLDAQDQRFERAMERLYAFLWKIAIGIILVLLTMVGWLIIQIYTKIDAGSGVHQVAAISCGSLNTPS